MSQSIFFFTKLYLVQLWSVFLVVAALFFLFEFVVPFIFGIQSKVRENWRDFLRYQFGRSVFSLTTAFVIMAFFYGTNMRMGIVNITQFSLFSQVVILFFCSELVIYIAHMTAHRYHVPLLTKAHRFHHSITTDMDWVNSRKEHLFVIGLFMFVYCFFFFVIFRSSSASHIITTSLYISLNALSHFRTLFSMKYFDQVFLFPKDHSRHHMRRGGPYGVTLSLFDTIFDTRDDVVVIK